MSGPTPGVAAACRWRVLAAAAALAALYYAGLLGVMAARTGHLPNYARLYDAPAAYAGIWRGTPSLRDALAIMADEPLFEAGHRLAQYGIAEWSLLVSLPELLRVLAAAALLAAFGARRAAAHRASCPSPLAATGAAAASAGLLALASASLTWVVCCAAPSWTVALSLLGVGFGLAQRLGPWDREVWALGAALALLALALQRRALVPRAPAAQRPLAGPARRA